MIGFRNTKNRFKELRGKAREQTGDDLGDRRMQVHGKAERTTANMKQMGEKIKGAFRR